MKIGPISIKVSNCITGVYLRWFYNGWHYFNFQNGYEITMKTESVDTQVTSMFSRISKIERPTKLKAEYSYQIILEGITAANIPGFTALLLAEKVEQYEGTKWYEVDINRGSHLILNPSAPGYILDFEITRKDMANRSTVNQKLLSLYLGDTLCDIDGDEVIPVNKQVNDIAEMQDRQSDFTAQFKIRKTRLMRDLFELSGEVGATTDFPYKKKACRLVQESIEMITDGVMLLDKTDDQYYYSSILSGNLNFFKSIDKLKITDLTLASTNHTWNAVTQAASHASDLDYVYPLLEPSDDRGIAALIIDPDRTEMFGGWIWPFVKVKAIWDEIFINAGFTCMGKILTDDTFLKLFMPIATLSISDTKKYLYSVWWGGTHSAVNNNILGFTGATLINGDENFRQGYYYLPFTATYKLRVLIVGYLPGEFFAFPVLSVYKNGSYQGAMIPVSSSLQGYTLEYEVTGTAGQHVEVLTSAWLYFYYSVSIVEIKNTKIGYGSIVTPHLNLPDISQTDFIKMICNMFALIPEVSARNRQILFWNYLDLYDNIAIARDWSAYLSEREDESEFKYGDYSQNNNLKYKDSDDVIKNNGNGIMQIIDETLPSEKDVVNLPVSTCDDVTILTDVSVSRINMNKYDAKTAGYIQNDKIDARIVYITDTCPNVSPPCVKVLGIRTQLVGGGVENITNPRKSISLEVSFSYLVENYAGLSRLLTKTNLRRAKFNLPVYEVSGLKHYIPIYLSQYKAYFYVNKINNYVSGKLCTIDLIKL